MTAITIADHEMPSSIFFSRCTVKGCGKEIVKAVNLALHISNFHVASKCGKCGMKFVGSKLGRYE